MNLYIYALQLRKNQKYKDQSKQWKTLPAGEFLFLSLGSIEHDGEECIVGVRSKKITDTSLVRRAIDEINEKDVDGRIRWFKENYPDINPIYIAERVIGGDGRPADQTKNMIIRNSHELKWDK